MESHLSVISHSKLNSIFFSWPSVTLSLGLSGSGNEWVNGWTQYATLWEQTFLGIYFSTCINDISSVFEKNVTPRSDIIIIICYITCKKNWKHMHVHTHTHTLRWQSAFGKQAHSFKKIWQKHGKTFSIISTTSTRCLHLLIRTNYMLDTDVVFFFK